MRRFIFFISIFSFLLTSCKQQSRQTYKRPSDADVLHNNQDQLTQVIIYDVFSPPVASRLYAYSSLASYEAMRFQKAGNESIALKLHGFTQLPQPDAGKKYDYTLAASKAFFTVVHKVVFSVDSLKAYEDNLFGSYKQDLDSATYNRSIAFGDTIGKAILKRASVDGYTKSRGKPKYLGSEEPGKWRPTPPDYMDGIEWCWNTMTPFVLDSATACRPPKVMAYSMDTTSTFYKAVQAVYTTGKNLTPEQTTIARYWDDNPFVIEHSGHLMFADKKITPGGHWMGITAIACRQTHADAVKTAKAYAATAIALFDGFISCWDEKYRSSLIRPVTVINDFIDDHWTPLLQTPPFPEYPSGHSVITRSAATVLTKIFGDNFSFQDTSDLAYIGMQRHFSSFKQAADEASISRFYGGIHYKVSVDIGAQEGKMVGDRVIQKLNL